MEDSTINKILDKLIDFTNNEDKDHIIREKIITKFLNMIENKIIQEEKTNYLENYCIICWKNKSKNIFIPCGHYCFCEECVTVLQRFDRTTRCPICRTRGDYYKVYPTGKANEYKPQCTTLEEKESY